jgi:hypothetical protein
MNMVSCSSYQLNYDEVYPQREQLCSCNKNKHTRPMGNRKIAQQTPKQVTLDDK